DLQAHGKGVRFLLVEHVDRIAARPRDDARTRRFAVALRADRIADHLVGGLGEAVELADVEIDPAQRIVLRLLRDQHDLRLDDAGVADHAAPRLYDRLGDAIAEMLRERTEDRIAIDFHGRHALEIFGREAAAEI